MKPLLLASTSPQRRDLLTETGIAFAVAPPPFPEPAGKPASIPAELWPAALAYWKARAVAEQQPGALVLGADTVAVCAGQVLGKPVDEHDAARMLELQARHPSDVLTGTALVWLVEECGPRLRREIRITRTRVWMRDDEAERSRYLASGDWRGKAGAYGIQSGADRLIERIEGSYSNVVGLPLETVRAMLAAAQ